MDGVLAIATLLGFIALLAWLWLLFAHGGFWRTDACLAVPDSPEFVAGNWGAVSVIVPARNEAEVLPATLPTLLRQNYPGPLNIVLVDDHSEDGTAEVAQQLASDCGAPARLTLLSAPPLPAGWTGKVWALHQGVGVSPESEFLLLTDADIAHTSATIATLVQKARTEDLDLASLMVQLRTETFWERLLIPAFVFFFAKLYPFRWVNDPDRAEAAAAGGCILLRRTALERAGGLKAIAGAVIDDCALARRIRDLGRNGRGRLWIGLCQQVRSRRGYPGLSGIWNMVARTAYTQLRYSTARLVGTVLGMFALYLAPPLCGMLGIAAALYGPPPSLPLGFAAALCGFTAWACMTLAYLPMRRWYRLSSLAAILLPIAALLFTLMTVDSARRHRNRRGGGWKGRTYPR